MLNINVFSNHKFGTSWLYLVLEDFARINNIRFYSTNRGFKSYSKDELVPRSLVFYRNAYYSKVVENCRYGVRIVRDPRSVVLSAYYSHLKSHALGDWWQLRAQRAVLEKVSKTSGLFLTLAFLERKDFYHGTAGPLCALSDWNFSKSEYTVLRIEDCFDDLTGGLSKIIAANGYEPTSFEFPDASKYAFNVFSGGRKRGEIKDESHFRSGSSSAWETELPTDLILYINAHYRNIIDKFYKDHSEVQKVR